MYVWVPAVSMCACRYVVCCNGFLGGCVRRSRMFGDGDSISSGADEFSKVGSLVSE